MRVIVWAKGIPLGDALARIWAQIKEFGNGPMIGDRGVVLILPELGLWELLELADPGMTITPIGSSDQSAA